MKLFPKRKPRWGLLIAGFFLLSSFLAFSTYGAGLSSPVSKNGSGAARIVTIKTDDADSLIAHVERIPAMVAPFEGARIPAEEMKAVGDFCADRLINVFNMGGAVKAVAVVMRPGYPYALLCMTTAPPTRYYAKAMCRLEGKKLVGFRPEMREVDCRTPLPPGAQSA